MSEFSKDKPVKKNRNPFKSILSNIRNYGSDYVFSEKQVVEVSLCLQKNEILIALKIDDSYYYLRLCDEVKDIAIIGYATDKIIWLE